MVERISVQIALEGGDAIERQLADIGDAGQKAFEQISASAEKVGGFQNLKPEEVTAKLKEVGVTGEDAIKKIQDAVSKATGLEKVVAGVAGIEGAFASLAGVAVPVLGAIAAAFVALIPSTIKAAEAISKVGEQATSLGQTIGQFDKLRAGLEQVGVSGKGIQETFSKLKAASADLQKVTFAPGVGFGPAAESLKQLVTELGPGTQAILRFVDVMKEMPDSVQRNKFIVDELGNELGQKLIQALKGGTAEVEKFKASLAQPTGPILNDEDLAKAEALDSALNRLSGSWGRFNSLALAPAITAGLDALTSTLDGIRGGLEATGQEFAALNSIVNTVGSAVYNFGNAIAGIVWDAISSAGVAAWEVLGPAIQASIDQVLNFAASLSGISWDSISGAGVAAWDALTGAIQATTNAAQVAAAALQSSGSDSGPLLSGFAGGGLLGGRGSGTSDSNLAWVSRGEHIMPAMAVAQPGVLGFLEALRRSGGNLSAVLDGLGRFALGGMVPRMAGGGSMSNVTIAFPGLPAIAGLRASSAVVDELRRAAAMAQVRSGGRKPSRYT